MSAAAVIVAGGRGVRFGEEGPRKQFRELAGVPVAARACRPFLDVAEVETVVLVVPPDVAAEPPGWVRRLEVTVTAGGAERRESVARGLAELPGSVGTVLVHDGVRPLVTVDLVSRVLSAAAGSGAIPVLPLRDTVKEVREDGWVVRTLDRSRLRRVQTPQGFPLGELRRAHREARTDVPATDDASLCEAAGLEVRTVAGDPENLKVTTPEDLARAAWILERRAAATP